MKIREGLDKLDATADLVARGAYTAPEGITFAQPVELHPEPAPVKPSKPIIDYDALLERLKGVKLYG